MFRNRNNDIGKFSAENIRRIHFIWNVNLDSCSKRDSRGAIGVETTIKYINEL